MRILLLCHSFNSLSQRLYAELAARGHTLSVELDIADSVTEEAVTLFRPDLLVAPFLKRRIPDSVWRALPCFIVHPGPPGDRGPAALDWAILEGRAEWGVTVLQADGDFDAGPVWAHAGFPMRAASKGALYRAEVTEAAVTATLQGYNQNLSRAAASLGASPVLTFFRVTLPLIAPGMISGALFAFATSFDEVVVTLYLAGPEQATLPRVMFSGIRENISPTIAAAATLLILTSVIMLLTLEWLRGRAEKMKTQAA